MKLMDNLVVRLGLAALLAFKALDDFFATALTIAYRMNLLGAGIHPRPCRARPGSCRHARGAANRRGHRSGCEHEPIRDRQCRDPLPAPGSRVVAAFKPAMELAKRTGSGLNSKVCSL